MLEDAWRTRGGKKRARQTTLIQLDRSRVENGIASRGIPRGNAIEERDGARHVVKSGGKYGATSPDVTTRGRVSKKTRKGRPHFQFSPGAPCGKTERTLEDTMPMIYAR